MYIPDIIWLDEVVEKIKRKHQVSQDEVEGVFCSRPRYRKAQKGQYEEKICTMRMVEPIVVDTCLLYSFIKRLMMR